MRITFKDGSVMTLDGNGRDGGRISSVSRGGYSTSFNTAKQDAKPRR